MKKIALALSIIALTACGGGGGGGDINNITGNSSKKLEGVWKSSIDEGTEGIDEAYYAFTSDGLATFYDYAGDSYDDFANCYWVGNAQFKSKGDNKYEFTYLETAESEIITITVSGNIMTVTEEGDDESSTLTKSSLKESDLIPECDETSNAPRQRTQKTTARFISPIGNK